jgi:hypothetical protein
MFIMSDKGATLLWVFWILDHAWVTKRMITLRKVLYAVRYTPYIVVCRTVHSD